MNRPSSGLLALQRAFQIADVARFDVAALDLHDDLFGLAGVIVQEGDDAIDPFVAPLFAGLAVVLTAERLGAHQRERPPLELVAIIVGKLAGGADVFRLADDPERDAGEHRCHAVFLQRDRQMGHVDADPAALQLVRGGDGRAAAAERVEHKVAGVAAGLDDALQEGEGLLGGVAETFLRLGVDRRNVRPDITKWSSTLFVKIAFQLRYGARLRLDSRVQRRKPTACVPLSNATPCLRPRIRMSGWDDRGSG